MIDETQIEQNGLWVFGYGSLMWNPGFDYSRRETATLSGYRRAFCMRSLHYRGTEAFPGLVLALEPETGGSCTGRAFHVSPGSANSVLTYLRERELISYAYFEMMHEVNLANGSRVAALCYVMNTEHSQYAKAMTALDQARIIARASGSFGPNRDYLFNTLDHLEELGIKDETLFKLGKLVRDLA